MGTGLLYLDLRVGCYHDYGYIDGKRLFPLYHNMRNKIIWKEMKRTFTEIAEACAELTKGSNYEVSILKSCLLRFIPVASADFNRAFEFTIFFYFLMERRYKNFRNCCLID